MPDTQTLLLEFSACIGVAGLEQQAADYARKLLSPYGMVTTTPLGSVLCTVCPPKEGKPHLLLDAHMDEIGMIVAFIEEDGFLRVAPCGGIDRRLLLASTVIVHTKTGPVTGVVCSIPPHLEDEGEKKNKKVEEIYIDIGYSKEKATQKVALGDRVTIHSVPRTLLNNQVSAKAIDDRAGCVAHVKALELLKAQLGQLDCGLTVAFTSMEEVGGQGAKTAAFTVNPTHAIAVDVSFAHTPDAPKEKCGIMGKGAMIGYAPILSQAISDKLVALAKEENIPYQTEVMGGKTGTNADQIATSRGGVLCGLLSIPQKYMHTPIETVAVEDVDNTARLIAAYIKALAGGKA